VLSAPTINGVAVFGFVKLCNTAENPRDEQRLAIPGLDGTGSLDMGDRGRITIIKGIYSGTNLSIFVANRQLIRSFKDGVPYPFTDTTGTGAPWVKLARFTPEGRIVLDGTYGLLQEYTAELHHL
jgi:hypothetical protein